MKTTKVNLIGHVGFEVSRAFTRFTTPAGAKWWRCTLRVSTFTFFGEGADKAYAAEAAVRHLERRMRGEG